VDREIKGGRERGERGEERERERERQRETFLLSKRSFLLDLD
jgi:hypothetical protein